VRSVVVALGGASGSGKSTVAAALARELGASVVDEAFYRLHPRPSLALGSPERLGSLEGRLVEEEARRYRDAQALAGSGRTVVADTSFLDPVSYTVGLALLGLADARTLGRVLDRALGLARTGRLGVPDLTVYLSVPARTRRRRVALDTVGHPAAYRDRHERVGAIERTILLPWLARALPGRVRSARGDGPVEAVVRRVRHALGRARPLGDPCRAAVRVLEGFSRLSQVSGSGNLKRGALPARPPR